MNKTLISRQLSSFGIPLLLLLSIILIAKSTIHNTNASALSFGITFDLLLTVPVIYFLLIRRTDIPKITIVPLFIIGMAVATIILPSGNQQFLRWAKTWILPIVETMVLILIAFKVRLGIKRYKATKESARDFFTTLKSTCSEVLPKVVVIPFATEIAVFYYGFLHWKRFVPKQNEFTYHKNSGIVTLLVAIILIVVIETSVIHILLLKWSLTAAWVMTALSTYTAIQLFGFLKSIIKRPISIVGNKLCLRYGILSEANVEVENIDLIELTTKSIEFTKETRRLSPFGDLENHNIVIRLKRECTLSGLYGITKTFRTIVLFVDNKDDFKRQLESLREH